jgi:tRNA(Ile)-lysidine synthetase-like protein
VTIIANNLENKFKFILEELSIFKQNLVLAVSGGPDSMVLLELLRRNYDNQKLYVVTIDHRIRENSYLENDYVLKYCEYYKIKAQQFNYEDNKKLTPEKARDFRKQKLQIVAAQNSAIIVTAHHYDDVIENFLIRLNRGSGINGLTSITNIISLIEDFYYLKPLLPFTKEALIEFSQTLALKYFIDESNFQNIYLRNRWRKKINNDSDYHSQNLYTTLLNLSRVNLMREEILREEIEKRVSFYQFGYLEINLDNWEQLHLEIRLAILSILLIYLGKNKKTPKLKQIQNLERLILNRQNFILEINGLRIEIAQKKCILYSVFYEFMPIKAFSSQKIGNYFIHNPTPYELAPIYLNQRNFSILKPLLNAKIYQILFKIRKFIPLYNISDLQNSFIIPTLKQSEIIINWNKYKTIDFQQLTKSYNIMAEIN